MTGHQRLGLCFFAALGSLTVAFLLLRNTFYLLEGLSTQNSVMLIVGVASVLAVGTLLLNWALEKLFGSTSSS
ncbi:hypothetical protein [Sphingomonas radiodurans]|uniref:hypothetical protein n=1 Tax=Sphingomonas radiodurans TaxID=2890321 RepID=UPI001E287C28|nr:hypothetical protein [Sphingomonas radiodurans]WBH17261.1 hypothetical protein LLW23_03895 [Sphingomonas radiodurans]